MEVVDLHSGSGRARSAWKQKRNNEEHKSRGILKSRRNRVEERI
jgi:hypothetical protein